MKKTSAVLLFTLLVGCVAQPPAASEQDIHQAGEEFVACTYETSKRLDDGVSDAGTIAIAVMPSCQTQYLKFRDLNGQALNPQARRMYDEKSDRQELGMVMNTVLKMRRDSRESKP